jgi:hypothetical protein
MNDAAVYDLLFAQQKQIRQLTLELEALKRMFFEHRPPFVDAFEHHRHAVEASGFLRASDDAIQRLEQERKESRKQ